MKFQKQSAVHSEPVKVSKIKRDLENKIYYFLDNSLDTPYVEFLIDLIEDENDKKLLIFYEILEKMQRNGLGKQFFPVLYLSVFSHFKSKQNLEENTSISIGGWPIFFYRAMSKGFDDAIRLFRGSHDDDEIVKQEFVYFLTNLYKDKGLELIKDTHLNKKSCYITDKAIQKEEIEKAIENYNNILTYRSLQEIIKKLSLEKIDKRDLNEEKLKKIGEGLFELKEYLKRNKDKYLKEISNYLNKNFYLKNLMEYGKTGNKVFLDKFGRLELDLYLPKNNYVEVGDTKMDYDKVFRNLVVFKFGKNGTGISIISPYYLTIMKLNAKRKKDINDLINLYESLFELNQSQLSFYNLEKPEEYLKKLPKEYKNIFLEELKKNKLYKNKNQTVLKIVDILENY